MLDASLEAKEKKSMGYGRRGLSLGGAERGTSLPEYAGSGYEKGAK